MSPLGSYCADGFIDHPMVVNYLNLHNIIWMTAQCLLPTLLKASTNRDHLDGVLRLSDNPTLLSSNLIALSNSTLLLSASFNDMQAASIIAWMLRLGSDTTVTILR